MFSISVRNTLVLLQEKKLPPLCSKLKRDAETIPNNDVVTKAASGFAKRRKLTEIV